MNKKFFNPKLYGNGVKRLRVLGVTFFILSACGTALPALLMLLSNRNTQYFGYNSGIGDISSFLTVLIIGIPFAFCLALFSFLNTRRGSDFYHSIPDTRVCLFISYAAAVLTWVLADLAGSLLLTAAVYLGLGVPTSAGLLLAMLGTYFSGAVLVTAAMLLAMSLTGTVFSNLALFGLILFLPRFITTLFASMEASLLQVVTLKEFGPFFDPNYNIPLKLLLALLLPSSSWVSLGDARFFSTGAAVYTLLLAAVYFALGCFLFHRRTSEMAGKSAPGKVLQHVYRCAVALPLTLVIPAVLVGQKNENFREIWQTNGNVFIVVTVCSLILYFLFELITSQKLKNLLKAAPVFLVVVALDVVFGFSLMAVRDVMLAERFSAGSISWVTMKSETNTGAQTYRELALNNVKLRDRKLIEAVADTFRSDLLQLRQNRTTEVQTYSYTVKIGLKSGRVLERRISADKAQQAAILAAAQSSAAYQSAQTALPSPSEVRQVYVQYLSDAQAKQLWQTFRKEYAGLSVYEREAVSREDASYTDNSIMVRGYRNFQNFQCRLEMYRYTPKTLSLYAKFLNRRYAAKLKTSIGNILNGKGTKLVYVTQVDALNFTFVKQNDTYVLSPHDGGVDYVIMANVQSSDSAAQREKFRKVYDILRRHLGESFRKGQPAVMINTYQKGVLLIPVSEREALEIHSIHQGNSINK